MDDDLSKPLVHEEVDRVVDRWLGTAGDEDGVRADVQLTATVGDVLDPARIAELRALADTMLPQLAEVFRAQAPANVDELSGALRRGDAAGMRELAHKLQGSALAIGARGLAGACAELEMLGGSGDLRNAPDIAARLPTLLAETEEALSAEAAR
jgi:HPt (histidine-containing phosphotransfer) domain-containing protein